MERILEMLKSQFPLIDFEHEDHLVTGGHLDSLAVVGIIAKLEDMFDISITMEYIQPDNFESVRAMWNMVQELQ
ncbi:MAG: acyl carrier protein [Clostridia bacterium]|nr:acyl carrier protein [Clostridia bacterium]MBQ6122275.1 acyl carrier protein [Clostridia bacterium]